MKKRIVLTVFVAMVLICVLAVSVSARTVTASGDCGDNLTWILYEDGELVIEGTGAMPKWKGLANIPWINYGHSVKKVVIKEGVTNISEMSFITCINVTSIYIPSSIEYIESNILVSSSSLTCIEVYSKTVILAANIIGGTNNENLNIIGYRGSTIEKYANEKGIRFVAMRDTISSGACGNNLAWTLYIDGELVIDGTGEMYVWSELLNAPWYDYRDSIKTVTICKDVSSIGSYAFNNCSNLIEATINSKKTVFGANIFVGTNSNFSICGYANSPSEEYAKSNNHKFISFREMIVSGECGYCLTWTLYEDGELVIEGTGAMWNWPADYYPPWYNYNELITKVKICDGVTTIGDYAFYKCQKMTSIEIPNSIISIRDGAFSNCVQLKSIEIPDSVTYMGKHVFYQCLSLENVKLSNHITKIDEGAFYMCNSLETVDIPDGVICIGYMAFANCKGLKSVNIPASVTKIENVVFFSSESLEQINVDGNNCNYTSVDGILFNNDQTVLICYPAGKTAKSYSIPDVTTTIGNGAFAHSTALTDINIPNSVISIGPGAFMNSIGLKNIVIPEGVTTIEYDVFAGCEALISVVIPDSVVVIGDSAFSGCKVLKNIDLPDSVTYIDAYAFWACDSLNNVDIPRNVMFIGEHAFFMCKSIKYTSIYSKNVEFGAEVFKYASDTFTIYGYAGSTAEVYAKENNHMFVALKEGIAVNDSSAPSVSYTVSEQLVTVTDEVVCKVGYLLNGKYVTVEAKANGNGGYDFEAPDNVTEVVLVVAGDLSGDGMIGTNDKKIFEDMIFKTDELTPEQFLAADVNGDGKVDTADLILIAKSQLGEGHQFHKELEW